MLGSASAAAASRTSATVATEESYLLWCKTSEESDKVLPALVHTNNDALRVSGALEFETAMSKMIPRDWKHDVQRVNVVEIPKLSRQFPDIVFSRPRFNVKLTSSVTPCDFLFQSLSQIRLVTVEVRRPDKAPFSRSWQVIIRPRFTLVSQLRDHTIVFKEAMTAMTIVGETMEGVADLVSAPVENIIDADDNAVAADAPRSSWNACTTTPAVHKPETAAPPTMGATEAASTHPLQPNGDSDRLHLSRHGETLLEAGGSLPYHFVRSKVQHRFTFAVIPNADRKNCTSWSGEIALTNVEADHCVLLRDSKGSPREPGATRVRCEVTPRANGTTTVTFTEDGPVPSFEIDNFTKYFLEVRQSQTSDGNIIVAAGQTRAIGWDEPMKPTSVKVRALAPYSPPSSDTRRHARNPFSLDWLTHAPTIVRESGANRASSDNAFVAISGWHTYAMETVSEREPIPINSESHIVLRAEGVVRTSTLVLHFTEEEIGRTPLPSSETVQVQRGLRTALDPKRCVLAVRIESGKNLKTSEKWQRLKRGKFHPYVVVSIAGVTKQNTPIQSGDVNDPVWTEKPLLFELEHMPSAVTFSILNKATDEREVLAVVRKAIPKSLFRTAARRDRERNEAERAGLDIPQSAQAPNDGWVTLGSQEWDSLLNLDEEANTQERIYSKNAVFLVEQMLRKAKDKSNREDVMRSVLESGDLYAAFDTFCRNQVMGGESNDGFIDLGPRFNKDDSAGAASMGENMGLTGKEAKSPKDADAEETVARANAGETVSTLPRLRVSIKVMHLPMDEEEEIRDAQGVVVKVENPLTNFLEGEETFGSISVNSLGLSVINVAKKLEVAYVIAQRMFLSRVTTKGGILTEASLGNVQIDNHIPNAQFPIGLYCAKPGPGGSKPLAADANVPPVFARVRLLVHTTHPTVRFVEMFRVAVNRLNMAFDERFFAEVAGVFVRSEQDLQMQRKYHLQARAQATGEPGQEIVVEEALVRSADVVPRAETAGTPNPSGATQPESRAAPASESRMMLYIDSFEIYQLRMTINLDLEGGREIDEADDTIAAGVRLRIPLLTIEVRDLVLKVAEMKRVGWFVSYQSFLQIIIRHYTYQGFLNAGRLLTNTNWAGNPLQAGKSVAAGFYFLIREPVVGARQSSGNPVYGFFHGLSAGSTALLANVATGISETVHGLSNTAVSAFNQVQSATRYDITTQPIATVVEMLRDVSGALAVSAREITDEVVALRFAKPVQIRKHRTLGQDGLVTEYGGGNVPAGRNLAAERHAKKRIVKFWRQAKAPKNKKQDLHTVTQNAAKKKTRAGGKEKRSAVNAALSSVKACCLAFGSEVSDVKDGDHQGH